MVCSQHRRTADVKRPAPRGVAPVELSETQAVTIYFQQRGQHQYLPTHGVPSASTYEAVFVGFDVMTGCVRRAVDEVALARVSLRILRFDSLIHNSGTVLYSTICQSRGSAPRDQILVSPQE